MFYLCLNLLKSSYLLNFETSTPSRKTSIKMLQWMIKKEMIQHALSSFRLKDLKGKYLWQVCLFTCADQQYLLDTILLYGFYSLTLSLLVTRPFSGFKCFGIVTLTFDLLFKKFTLDWNCRPLWYRVFISHIIWYFL